MMVPLFLLSFPALALGVDQGSLEARLLQLEEIVKAQKAQMHLNDDRIHQLQDEERRLSESDSTMNLTGLKTSLESLYNNSKKDIEDFDKAIVAEEQVWNDKAVDMGKGMDHIYLIVCGALVMFMQAGFAMVEAGCCRSKNVQNILLKNLTDVCVGTLGWWAFGCAFAYGNPDEDEDGMMDNKFIGTTHFFGMGYLETDASGVQSPVGDGGKMLNWFFQWAFCGAAATIVSGGVAERVNFPGYVFYSFMMTSFIYPVVVAWTWGYGWLAGGNINDIGFMDFAGSGIVHMTGGVGALVGAIIAGPRNERWSNPDAFVPHSLPLVVLGTFILWFGWYGFNCGSTLGLSDSGTGYMAAHVAMNTTIAAATCGLVVFLLRMALLRGAYDIGGFCNGILAGLVSITAGCGNLDVGATFITAVLGGLIYQGASVLMKKCRIDDPIDAFAVHGACGAWGVMACALFDWGKGVDYAHGWSGFACFQAEAGKCMDGAWGQLVAANLAEVAAICAWVAGLSVIVFLPLRLSGFLRATEAVQEIGMDVAKHSPSKAYTIDAKQVNTAARVTMQVGAKDLGAAANA